MIIFKNISFLSLLKKRKGNTSFCALFAKTNPKLINMFSGGHRKQAQDI